MGVVHQENHIDHDRNEEDNPDHHYILHASGTKVSIIVMWRTIDINNHTVKILMMMSSHYCQIGKMVHVSESQDSGEQFDWIWFVP